MIFAASFKLRGHDTHINFLLLLFLMGMICPLMQEHFLKLNSFETLSSSLRLNKGFRLLNFLQNPSLI